MQKGADPLDAARARLEREYLSGLESSPSDQRAERVIPDALTCSISLDIMQDPVMACDGHTYERAAIEAWLSANSTSPKTGEVLESTTLGVVEPDLGKAIAEATGAHCRSDDVVRELLRGARQHLTKFVPELQNNLLEQAQVGLGHAFSRCKVKAPS